MQNWDKCYWEKNLALRTLQHCHKQIIRKGRADSLAWQFKKQLFKTIMSLLSSPWHPLSQNKAKQILQTSNIIRSSLFNVLWFMYFYGICILGCTPYSQCLARWPNTQRSSDAAYSEPHLTWNTKVRRLICTLDDQLLIPIPTFSVNFNLDLMFNHFSQ